MEFDAEKRDFSRLLFIGYRWEKLYGHYNVKTNYKKKIFENVKFVFDTSDEALYNVVQYRIQVVLVGCK